VVISSEPLTEHVPLYKGAKGEVTTQYPMTAIEKIGLLKMDFLGLRTLTVIMNTVKLIQQSRGVTVDVDEIPHDDAPAFQLLGEAKTFGVFQLESSGMRDLLRQLRPNCIEDIVALVAMYRPGPMEQIPKFIERKHGRTKVEYEHPLMEAVLKETYGIMVYQEQVMRIASDLAGFSLGEADILRRAMGKKSAELMAEQRKKFVDGALARGIAEKKADKIFSLMEQFAGYGFNKSHAAAYAIIAYQTAYLKANYPVEFMAALLTSETNDTDKIVKYIEECRVMGLEVLPPDVNESSSDFTVVGDKIRFGLVAVKNVGETAIQSILTARRNEGKFHTLYDFCERVDLRLVNKRVVESLIKCGAFDSLGARRAQLAAVVDKAMEAAASAQRDRAHGQVSLLDVLSASGTARREAPPLPNLPEWDRSQLLTAEKETLGFYITGHPLAEYRATLDRYATATTETLPSLPDKSTARLGAIVTAVKEISTKSGDRMAFVTLEDLNGTVESVVFPDVYRSSMLHLAKDSAVLVKGQVDIGEDGSAKLLVSEVRSLTLPANGGAPLVEVTLSAAAANSEGLRRLEAILKAHPGSSPLRLNLELPEGDRVTIAPAASLAVMAGEKLTQALEAEFGSGCVSTR
jgi:DNA polymerase III subunit alpha